MPFYLFPPLFLPLFPPLLFFIFPPLVVAYSKSASLLILFFAVEMEIPAVVILANYGQGSYYPIREIIRNDLIKRGLNTFRASFSLICEDKSISCTLDTLSKLCDEDIQNLALDLLSAFRHLPATRLLRSKTIYNAVTKLTPPPRPIPSFFQPTPWLCNTSNFANSLEHCKYVDDVLKEEFGPMYDDVLNWFADFSIKLSTFAEAYKLNPPIDGSIVKCKMDIGFVNNLKVRKDLRYHWSQILMPKKLKSNPSADKASEAWLDLGRYAREFIITILGFLWMSEEQLRFDPTIITSGDKRYIDVELNGQTKRLIIDRRMKRAPCIAGRATTCWKAHCKGDPQTSLVIKDLWQYTEREEESELLREATDQGVVNVAKYYYHETVQVRGLDDNIQTNVRKGLDIITAENYQAGRTAMSRNTSVATPRKGRSTAGVKRSSSQTGAPLLPNKRSYSASPTKPAGSPLPNRVHRRVILRTFGEPIYKASSRVALLRRLEGCINKYKSLHKTGIFYKDILINNLIINEDNNNMFWLLFLIDLNLVIKEQREVVSGAKGKTGTRAFIAIGALFGEQYSFIHDLESFFWVLFWIYVHYKGPDQGQGNFLRTTEENFTAYYQPLIPWVNRLRKAVFPNGGRWEREDRGLYSRMNAIFYEVWNDPTVLVDK
ncbi:uncharacterized protein F4812DRAFT_453675 [Daldinia caldariorum]|uniref:uncharacterized protein n=1 Tax=Daldinia caldariorum TaxID=326644 RepID=UPI0020088818|nr:uncharacterized protein F4812DRAFT_453675 [Daldinia caldariorum]KAI1463197.1 hypothetical protein F4812DRAFT_453675 [Daldinia caldariorum]